MAYFPNGSAGEVLDRQCAACPLGGGPCPVALVQSLYNYDQLDDGESKLRECLSLLVSDDGVCQVRQRVLQDTARKDRKYRGICDWCDFPLAVCKCDGGF